MKHSLQGPKTTNHPNLVRNKPTNRPLTTLASAKASPNETVYFERRGFSMIIDRVMIYRGSKPIFTPMAMTAPSPSIIKARRTTMPVTQSTTRRASLSATKFPAAAMGK